MITNPAPRAALPPPNDRANAWLALMTALTARRADWIAWKGYDSALMGDGDVDSVAPAEAWPDIIDVFVAWAREHGLGPVVTCPHAPGLLHLIALPKEGDLFFELDVNRRKVFLGSTLFQAPDLEPLAVIDERGVRRLRPAGEGMLKLIHNGMRRRARVRWDQIETKGILRSLRADRDGIAIVAPLFGSAAGPIERGARAVLGGRWDRPAMLAVEARSLVRAVLEPDAVVWRLKFRWQRRHCPLLRSVFDARRRVPWDHREAWLREVVAYGGHQVIDGAGDPPDGFGRGARQRRGRHVVIAGPDGVGKSTFAAALIAALDDTRVHHYHHRLGPMPRRAASLVRTTRPHAVSPYPTWLAAVKVGYLFADYLIGTALLVRPAQRRGHWVILERGWWDIAIDPARYRLARTRNLTRCLGRLLPAPDLLIIMEAPLDTILARKAELEPSEINRQLVAWRLVATEQSRTLILDSRLEVGELVQTALAALGYPPPSGG